ncbi:MAG: permease [Dehalococcoidales bacterium]|nr:permease [Dehalococcoidales bacterium]
MRRYFKKYQSYIWVATYVILTILAFIFGFNPGKTIFTNFTQSLVEMITFVPFLFIIVGLFDVWVPKDKIQKHIGQESGIKGIALVVLLAMFQAGPLYGAFPVAYLLYRKGASIRNIFIYLGAFSSMKIPMLGIEIGYLGIEFSVARTLVSLPLFIGIGYLMERYLKNKHFEVRDGSRKKEMPS